MVGTPTGRLLGPMTPFHKSPVQKALTPSRIRVNSHQNHLRFVKMRVSGLAYRIQTQDRGKAWKSAFEYSPLVILMQLQL